MNEQGNWIKISKQILEWGWYKDSNTFGLFIHLLLKANWKDGNFKGSDIQRGSLVTSLQTLKNQTGMTIREVRTAIQHLISTGEITVKTTNKFSIITIVNYSKYQDKDANIDKQTTNKRQTNDKQATTIEEYKEYKEYKNIKKEINKEKKNDVLFTPHFDNEEVNLVFLDFLELRKSLKVKNTERAVKLLINDLSKYDDATKIKMIEQSIKNSWKSVYELKSDSKKKYMTSSERTQEVFDRFLAEGDDDK